MDRRILAERVESRMNPLGPDRKVLRHQCWLCRADRVGLTVVLDEFDVVAEVRELAAHLFVFGIAGVLVDRGTMQHHDRWMRPAALRPAVIFLNRLSAGREIALDPSGGG